ncbi:dethiobiotin synthetase [Cupriavidus sp. CV2]|uniref:dethiobiotin synthetase n=1 Tax=Cupriavidus ulmosensis TaxID=3065913 RepID=UPI00296B1F50|nr:dethiobiotin synthetase [Cupriavidus sp. CV2]MDW3688675.1 dethiobiotin synthetase [Cupriavidus sp. CV2]
MIPIFSTNYALTLRTRLASPLLALAAAAIAVGCASPAWQSVAAGASQAELQARLGTPREIYPLPDGSQRWFYPAAGETKWSAELDPSGHVVSVRQMLTGEEFAQARIGQWTTRDVLLRFGKPGETVYFSRMRRTVWSYRFAQDAASYSTMHFYFDPQGVLRLTQVMPDFLLEQ